MSERQGFGPVMIWSEVGGYERKMFEALRSGSLLSSERVGRIARVCLAVSFLSVVWLLVGAHGTLDWKGRPLGTDFSEVWAAGRMVLDGRAADVWDWPKHFAVQQQIHHSRAVDVYGWHYPPPFLLIATLLATLPYLLSLFLWQAATLTPFAMLIGRIVKRRDAWLYVLAAPATLICVAHGHNGFLTALLLGGGLLLLERRPFVAGLLLGALVYKPQFALLLPLLLLITSNWRAIGGAALSSLTLIAITLIVWGWPVWHAFLGSLPITQHIVIEQGRTGWQKIMSAFSAVRSWGGGIPLAYAVQTIVTVSAGAACLWIARTGRAPVRNAAVSAAVLLSTPYVLDYDFVVLGLAIAWLWRDGEDYGFAPWERSLLALAWAAPLFARGIAELTLVPLGLASAIAVLGVAIARSLTASPFRRSHAVSVQ